MRALPAWNSQIEITADSSGSTLRDTIDCSAVISCEPTRTESMQMCGRAAWPPSPSILMSMESVAGHDRARADRERADRNARTVVHAVDLLDTETVHQPVLDHRGRARAALFGGLEDHDGIAGEIPRLGEITGSTEQHRGVAVMAAGVHHAGRLRGVRQIGLLLDRQRIHVGAQPDHLHVAFAGRLVALDDADDAGAAEPGGDLVAAEFPQAIRHECCSAVDVVQQFGIFMDIPAPGLDIGLQIGDAVDDGHGISVSG